MSLRILSLVLLLTLNSGVFSQSLEEGIELLNSGQAREAYEVISRFFVNHTQNGAANFYMARLEQDGQNSATYLQDAISLLPEEKEGELARIILAQYNYSQGLYITAAEILSGFKKDFPASQYMPQALYTLACSYLASEQVPLAKKELELILSSFGTSDLAPWAQAGLGDCQYALGKYGAAAGEYQKILDKYGWSEVSPLAMSQLSRCYTELKDDSKAYLYANLLKDKFPSGAIFPLMPVKEMKSKSGAEQMVDVTYTVQLGVFGNKSSVSNLVRELKSRDYQPRTFSKAVDKKKYTVVQVGTYLSVEEAKRAKEKLEQEFGGPYRVVIKE